MSRKIKLIWDFRGEVATKTAEHHDIHLKEYLEKEKIVLVIFLSVYNDYLGKCLVSLKNNSNFFS